MKTYAKYISTPLLGLLLLAPASFAQDNPPDSQPQAYTQAELDQILAPIALYPDSLLSQILMASTYPLEVVEAARWSRANPGFEGEAAVRMVEDRDWDHSVKSLVAFPKVLEMMDEKLDWTQSLGNAYLSLPEQVTETVQNLRQKADAAGNLKSNKHYRVEHRDGNISVEPQNPEVVYVPYYDPLVVYGSWWWPAYPPVYWAPWPGYYAYPGLSGFYWSLGIFIGPRFFFGGFDWHHRHITSVNRAHFNNFRHVRHAPNPSRHAWKHNPRHRRGVGFRRPFAKNQFARTFREAGPKFHGNFPRRQSSARAPRFESRDGSRFQSRFEQGKRSFSDSRKFEPRSDNRRGPTRADRNSPAPNSEFQRDRRRMPMVQNRSGGSAVKNSNSDRNFERRSNARRGGAWSDNMRGSIRSNGFSNRGRTPGVKNAPVSSFSSKKSVRSRSFKRGDFSARRGSPGIKGKQGKSFSSKKSFNWKDSGGSRSFGNFRRGNGGGGNKFRSR